MWSGFLIAALTSVGALANPDLRHWDDGSDLESFVSRPEIKAPRMMVSKHYPKLISDGYWFVTPYSNFEGQRRTARKEFMPCQTGAHIYDGDGNLVWSGACWGGNRNIFAFRPAVVGSQQVLTMYLSGRVLGDDIKDVERNGSGIVMNHHYEEVIRVPVQEKQADFHEFNVLPGGASAILITHPKIERDAPEVDQAKRRVLSTGFQEIHLASNKVIFDWDPTKHGVLLNESYNMRGLNNTDVHYDYLHLNSVDKNLEGDYFLSGRHTSTIYKVSGKDGHVIWRLGGHASDFVMEKGLDFFWQHDARFLFQNETTTIISVFDNTAEDEQRNPDIAPTVSSGKVIALNTASKPMTARVLRRIDRPDGEFSNKLGNVQVLGNNVQENNILVNWGIRGYMSEHDVYGTCVMEARFQSERMSSYRAYKSKFVGEPTAPPTLKVLPMKVGKETWTTAFYASWNGATEVAGWNFYGGSEVSAPFRKIGAATKMGFETSWVAPSLVRFAYVEAIDRAGKSVGWSSIQSIGPLVDGAYRSFSSLQTAHMSLSFNGMQSITSAKAYEWFSLLVFDSFAVLGLFSVVRRLSAINWRRRWR